MQLAFSYLRFSSAAQTDGDSIRRQTALRDAWLKRHPEVQLDTSLKLEDKGVSGYKGRHRKDGKHALAKFLDLVERGRVPTSSYLIVENLDRLTREEMEDSIPLVLTIIKAGIRVVQLAPAEMVYERGMDFGRQMMMLYELGRGHGESKRKSGLLGDAWIEKKEQCRTAKMPHGTAVPFWIELLGVRTTAKGRKDYSQAYYRLREDRARTVRMIFQLCREGLGLLAIAQKFNADGVPVIGRSSRWHRGYVAKIIHNEACRGTYQPWTVRHGKHEKDGEPIPGFFPAVIDEAAWHAAHAALKARERRSGRPGRNGTYQHVFSGLLRSATDQCALHVITRRGQRYVVSHNALTGKAGSCWHAFPVEPLVDSLLAQLQELKASSLFSDPGADKGTVLEGRLQDVDKRLAVALAKFDADPESPTWAAQVDKYDKEKRALVKEKKAAEMEASNPLSGAWAEAVQLMKEKEPQRLRAALLSTVESVTCLIVPQGKIRLCIAQVHFVGGSSRCYTIWHRAAAYRQPAVWKCWPSVRIDGEPLDLDLRKPQNVNTEKLLTLLAIAAEEGAE